MTLTPRLKEILQLMANGQEHKQIADTLHLSCRTVNFHACRIRKRLNALNGPHAVAIGLREGLIHFPE